MFTVMVLVVHVVVCLALILIILLQSGKGADIGAVFGGGGGGTVFGPSGAATFLSKITIIAAVVFMITSIVLSYFAAGRLPTTDKSVIGEQSEPAAPGDLGKTGPVEPPKDTSGAVPSVPAPAEGDSIPKTEPPAAPATQEKPAAPAPSPPAEKK